MTSVADPLPAYPQYAHQLQALLRRLAREDREAIGASLRRGGFGKREIEPGPAVSSGRARVTSDAGSHTLSPLYEATGTRQRIANAGGNGGRTTLVDFSRASPLSVTPRQTGPVRIPHFDIVRVSRTVVPRAKDGRTHPRYPDRSGIAAAHHDYVILSFTCVAAPMFRSKIERLAADQSIDVMLVRCCLTGGDLLPVSIDVVLAGGGLTPFKLEDLALYRHDDGGLWLVPFGFGGAIRLEAHGLELYLVPPYAACRWSPARLAR